MNDYLTEAIEAGRAAIKGHVICDTSAERCECYDVAIRAAAPIIERAVWAEREVASKEVMHALLDALREFRDAIAPPLAPDHEVRSWPLWAEAGWNDP